MATGRKERETSRAKQVGLLMVGAVAMALICSIAVASFGGIVFGE